MVQVMSWIIKYILGFLQTPPLMCTDLHHFQFLVVRQPSNYDGSIWWGSLWSHSTSFKWRTHWTEDCHHSAWSYHWLIPAQLLDEEWDGKMVTNEVPKPLLWLLQRRCSIQADRQKIYFCHYKSIYLFSK